MVMTIKKGASKKIISQKLTEAYSTIKRGFEASKFCGVLNLKEDPLSIQKRLRDEWE